MLVLERKFLESFDKEDKVQSKKYLEELIESLTKDHKAENIRIRYLKNYLIWLNAIMFEKTYLKPSCKKRLLKSKNSFFKIIESKKTFSDLFNLSLDMLNFYFDSIGKRCKMMNPIVNNAILYIDDNLDQDLSLENLSKHLNVSSSYLSLLFNETTGISFSNFINLRRIEKAKLLLETTDLTLMEITLECGFNSQSYFCYVFKKKEKITPTSYRNQNNLNII